MIRLHKLTEKTYHGNIIEILVKALCYLLHFNEEVFHPNVLNLS